MPRSTRSATTFAQAQRAVECAQATAENVAKRQALKLIRSMKGKLPPRLTILEWSRDGSGSALGVFRALVLITEGPDKGKLFLLDRRYMGPADDLEITQAVPLLEPREVYWAEVGDSYWLNYWGKILSRLAEVSEQVARGEEIPDSSETRIFKGPVRLDIGREPLVHYGAAPFGG